MFLRLSFAILIAWFACILCTLLHHVWGGAQTTMLFTGNIWSVSGVSALLFIDTIAALVVAYLLFGEPQDFPAQLGFALSAGIAVGILFDLELYGIISYLGFDYRINFANFVKDAGRPALAVFAACILWARITERSPVLRMSDDTSL